MKPNKINRLSHTGKTPYEKEAYKEFLAGSFHLDKTESDPVDTSKTDASSFEDGKTEPTKPSKKSNWLKIKDYFNNNLVITIVASVVGGLILILISGYFTIAIDQKVQAKQIEALAGQQKENNALKEMFIAFKSGVTKDLEYIKKRLKM